MKLSPKARQQVEKKARIEGRLRLVRPLLVVFGLVFAVSVFVVLSDLKVKGSTFKVTVGPAFFTVPIDTQQEFARTVNCFFVKGANKGVSFDLIHWQTGKNVASWNGDRLDVD